MYKTFTKSDLKNRMIVIFRNQDRAVFIDGYLLSRNGYCSLVEYTDNLLNEDVSFRDIVQVTEPTFDLRVVFNLEEIPSRYIIWIREEVKEVTMAEVEEKFGCKVKIINDKNT